MTMQDYTTTTETQEEEVVVNKPTKGELFRKKNGYSITMAKNMKRAGATTVAEYRPAYKVRKYNELIARKAKKAKVRAKKAAKDKTKK